MLDQIKARLKAKYPGVNLSQKRIDAIAAKLEPKITEESQIDAKLDELNENGIQSFAEMAKEDDQRRTLEAKLKDKQKTTPDPDDDDEPTDDPKKSPKKSKKSDDEAPAWAKAMMEEFTALKKEKSQQSISEKVKAHEKLKDIPASFLKGRTLPETEEGIEEFVSGVEADYTEVKQEFVNQGLSGASAPVLGKPNKDGISSEVETYIKEKSSAEGATGALGGKKL